MISRNLLVDLIAVMNHELAPTCTHDRPQHAPDVDADTVRQVRDRLIERLAEREEEAT